jgi:hypothetical protein
LVLLPENAEIWKDVPVNTFQAQFSYCNQTDTMPLRCEHVVKNRERLSSVTVFMLALVSVLAMIPTVADLDQMGDEAALVASLPPRPIFLPKQAAAARPAGRAPKFKRVFRDCFIFCRVRVEITSCSHLLWLQARRCC